MRSVLAIILGGGAGTRLFPLTHLRSKPAVPFGGKYRIIDVPLSNCLNSNINRIFVLTQYNSASLNHHVTESYRFSQFSRGFVQVLAAEQTPFAREWFQGTADAVRQSLHHMEHYPFEHALILSGDQLYQMDFNELLQAHVECGAAVTVATTPVTAADATGFGIMKVDGSKRIVEFVEKPPLDALGPLATATGAELEAQGRVYLASMGIYVFNRETLIGLLRGNPEMHDFGKHIIPLSIREQRVCSFPFAGYWTDIGTIGSLFEANLALTDALPRLNLYDENRPIFTHARMLPPTKTHHCQLDHALLGQGAILEGCDVRRSIVGVRAIVSAGAQLRECVIMGADSFESAAERAENRRNGRPDLGVGENARLERVIVDKNARIGRDVVIRSAAGRPDHDGDGWYVRDGVVVVAKDTTIPAGTVI